jgi:hypothetical protein
VRRLKMEDKPYKCPKCFSGFKTESGMKCHLGRQHETPAALDAIGKDYEAKLKSFREDIVNLEKRLDQIESEKLKVQMQLVQALEEGVEKTSRITDLDRDIQKMALLIAVRDRLIKEKLGITMPLPSSW